MAESTSTFENYQKGLLGAEAFRGPNPVREEVDRQVKARTLVFDHARSKLNKHSAKYEHFKLEDVFVVWFCKTLQNWKAIVCTNLSDGKLYEVTYNGNKRETYVDEYKKVENVCIPDTEAPDGDR